MRVCKYHLEGKDVEKKTIKEVVIQLEYLLFVYTSSTHSGRRLVCLCVRQCVYAVQTTEDLEEVDRKRREEFKTYEMEKEYGYKKKLEDMSPEEKKEAEERHQQLKEKHKQHEKINHPVSTSLLWDHQQHQGKKDSEQATSVSVIHDTYWKVSKPEIPAIISHMNVSAGLLRY